MKKNKKLNYKDFISTVFPYKSPFERKHFGPVTNFIKVFALRSAFILYKIGITANILDLFALCLIIPGFSYLYLGLFLIKLNYLIFGYFAIAFVLFIDFVDGSLARIHNYEFKVGDDLDNLPPDIIRIGSIIMIGIMTNNIFMIGISFCCAITLNIYGPNTIKSIPEKSNWILSLAGTRMSLTGIRVLVGFILPSTSYIFYVNRALGSIIACSVVVLYAFISLSWIILTLKDRTPKENL